MTGESRHSPLVVVSANQAWNLANYRAGLIRALIDNGYAVLAVAPPDPEWEDWFDEMGCAFLPVPVDAKGLSPFRDVQTLLAYVRLFRRHRPAAFLGWTIKPNAYGGLAAALAGVPAFPNVSGLGTAFVRRTMLTTLANWLYRIAFRRARTVFFQNRTDLDQFVAGRLIQGPQACLLPGSGIDLDRFAVPPGGRPGRRQFLMMARLISDKGVREFVAAARSIRRTWPDARFRLLGFLEVANRTAIASEEVHAWAQEGIIEYVPPVKDVRPFIAEADFVVLPTYYREGLSRALLEAAAMGRPIVTTDWPGCREVVTDGVNGYLCTPRDIDSLTSALERAAMTDDAQWLAMSRAGREKATAEFSQQRVIDLYLKALADAGISP